MRRFDDGCDRSGRDGQLYRDPSRRDFLVTAAGLAGVSSLAGASARRAGAQTSRPVQGARGGVLKVALATEPSSLDNHTTTDTLVAGKYVDPKDNLWTIQFQHKF